MRIVRCFTRPARVSSMGLLVLAILASGIASCKSPRRSAKRTVARADSGWVKANKQFHEVSYGRMQVAVPEVAGAEMVDDDSLCETCHEAYVKAFENNVHRGESCESCHGPASRHMETRGKEPGLILSFKTLPAAEKSELCQKCHEEHQCAEGSKFRYSKHAHCGVACTDCHNAHYGIPPGTPATAEPGASASLPIITTVSYQNAAYASLGGSSNALGAEAPYVCYKCHGDMQVYQQIAGPHQICGPNGFNCTTCHDAHGKIREETRKELCLECHGAGSPTMAYHSSVHNFEGVACTDCHNPHPSTKVPRVVNISHTSVDRPERLMMSVDEPSACLKCHPKIMAQLGMPSHHPIKEGKMTCTGCHDPHGQFEGNLRADRINDVCWRCHAEKQGPFAWEHPPVTENCAICHEPHGTVANNLLRQPTTFLCLRCHTGHKARHGSANINGNIDNQLGFYTDCTRCHTQIHGSDLPSPWVNRKTDFMR